MREALNTILIAYFLVAFAACGVSYDKVEKNMDQAFWRGVVWPLTTYREALRDE